jgi:hypothetical protein
MQTSGNRSSISRPADGRTSKVAGAGAVVGFLALASAGWMACSPGVIDCEKVSLGCPGGGGGKGGPGGDGGESGMGGTSGTSGKGGMGGTVMGGTGGPPSDCDGLGVKTVKDFETKFIAPKCGMSMCHQAVFPPRNLNMPDMIEKAVVGVKGQSLCKTDFYVNKTDYKKSFMLAKVSASGDNVQCPAGGPANGGGTRMPNSMPAVVGTKLTAEELGCFTWWIQSVAEAM